ncbi:unnamed protein product [Urochloa humidicola]
MSPHTCNLFSSTIALILFSLAAWVATAVLASNEITNTIDHEALLCIMSHLSYSNRTALATWNNGSTDFCRWQGISCSRLHGHPRRVIALDLEGEGIVGQIPPCISNLTYLARIHLPFNEFHGPMPPALGQLRKLSDFGLSRFLHGFSSSGGYQNSTTFSGARGSVGYIPPEYGMGSRISPEGDVYSYGIILLEILTAKRPTDEFKDDFTLHKYVEEGLTQFSSILDPDLRNEIGGDYKSQSKEEGNEKEMHKCILQLLNLGLLCSQESPKDRPNIKDVYGKMVAIKDHFLRVVL